MSVPDRSDRRAFELYRHSVEMANIEGKELERWNRDFADPEWERRSGDAKGMPLDWTRFDYRLAPEPPAVQPWTFETAPVERMKVRSKDGGALMVAVVFPDGFGVFGTFFNDGGRLFTFAEFADQFEQLDGTPCGIVQASEWPKYGHNPMFRTLYRFMQDGRSENILADQRDKWEFYAQTLSFEDWLDGDSNRKQITASEAEALIEKAKAGK